MERVEQAAVLESAPSCAGCGGPRDGARCGHCGVAHAPGGLVVERVVSQSPHGRLYLARDDAGRPLALKELVFSLVPDTKTLDAFEREGRLLEALDHPGIPRFVRTFAEGSGVGTRLYLAQQFVRGHDLLTVLRSRRVEEPEALGIARQALEILAYLHEREPPVVHRDVKPSNLMLRDDGSVALVDFGTARDLHRGTTTNGATLVGSFGYMPPEQLGGTVSPRSDLYALGATLVHLLSRRPPEDLLREDDLSLAFERHVRASRATKRFLRGLLARRPEHRFASAREALRALDAPRQLSGAAPAAGKGLLAISVFGGLALTAAILVRTGEQRGFDKAVEQQQAIAPAAPSPARAGPVHLRARFLFDAAADGRVPDTTGKYTASYDGAERVPGLRAPNALALTKDGASIHVSAASLDALPSGSVVMLVRLDEARPRQYLLVKADAVGPPELALEVVDGKLRLSLGRETLTGNRELQPGLPYEITASWGPSGRKLYVDGVLDAWDTAPSSVRDRGFVAEVGRDPRLPSSGSRFTVQHLLVFDGEVTADHFLPP